MGCLELKDGPKPVSGTIDRMAVLDDEVIILDYKTSNSVPADIDDIPPDYVTQMALYRALVERLYPTKLVRCILIWTHAPEKPRLFELPPDQLSNAFARIAQL